MRTEITKSWTNMLGNAEVEVFIESSIIKKKYGASTRKYKKEPRINIRNASVSRFAGKLSRQWPYFMDSAATDIIETSDYATLLQF